MACSLSLTRQSLNFATSEFTQITSKCQILPKFFFFDFFRSLNHASCPIQTSAILAEHLRSPVPALWRTSPFLPEPLPRQTAPVLCPWPLLAAYSLSLSLPGLPGLSSSWLPFSLSISVHMPWDLAAPSDSIERFYTKHTTYLRPGL